MKTIEIEKVIEFLEQERKKFVFASLNRDAATTTCIINTFKQFIQMNLTIGDLTRLQIMEHRKIEKNMFEVEMVHNIISNAMGISEENMNDLYLLDTPIKVLYEREQIDLGDIKEYFEDLLEIEVDEDYD